MRNMVRAMTRDRAAGAIGFGSGGRLVGALSVGGPRSRLPATRITDLDQIPDDERPLVNLTHLAFQVMIGVGTALLGLGLWALFVWRRTREPG